MKEIKENVSIPLSPKSWRLKGITDARYAKRDKIIRQIRKYSSSIFLLHISSFFRIDIFVLDLFKTNSTIHTIFLISICSPIRFIKREPILLFLPSLDNLISSQIN